MKTTLIPARAKSLESAPVDHLMAKSILDRLGYGLRDLSLEYGDVVIPQNDVTHELYYPAVNNSHTIACYIYCDVKTVFTMHLVATGTITRLQSKRR